MKQTNAQRNGFRVLVTGTPKSGRSTLINALLGKAILPTDSALCAQVPIEIKWGERRNTLLHFRETLPSELPDDLLAKVREHIWKHGATPVRPLKIPAKALADCIADSAAEPTNKNSVYEKAELFLPEPLLEHGLELVDALSLTATNKDCESPSPADGVILVMSAPSACAAGSAAYMEQYQRYLSAMNPGRLLVVVNRMDQIPQNNTNAVTRFVREHLSGVPKENILFVSALDGLHAWKAKDVAAYEASGMAALEAALEKFPNMPDQPAKPQPPAEAEANNESADYLSWNNIGELVHLNDHMAYAQQLIESHDWAPDVKADLNGQFRQIQEKQRDKLLNLSVVGDFSTGKSTFINALLRLPLLETSSLQSTTIAATILEYAPDYSITLETASGQRTTTKYATFEELRDELRCRTSDLEAGKDLRYVYLTLPSETLAKGFRIIDTPGLNATDRWLEDVTIRTLEEHSDLSVILVDATQPLPDGLCTFLEEHLSSLLNQCAFVVNKLNLIPENERDRMMQYIGMKCQTSFELESPMLLAYSPLEVLTAQENPAEPSAMLHETYANEERLIQHMARQRAIAQTKKLITLIDRMYDSLSKQITSATRDTEEQLALLERTKKVDLSQFIARQKRERCDNFSTRAQELCNCIETDMLKEADTHRNDILSTIRGQSSIDNLNAFISTGIQSETDKKVKELDDFLNKRIEGLKGARKEEITAFRKDFKRQYENLRLLTVSVSDAQFQQTEKTGTISAQLGSVASFVSSNLSTENKLFGGGAATGAAAGFALGGPMGALVGGAIGGIAGLFFAPDTQKVARETADKTDAPLRNYFTVHCNTRIAWLQELANKMEREILAEIDRYVSAHGQAIDKMIEAEKKKRADVESRLTSLRAETNQIQQRRSQMTVILQQLNTMIQKG